METAYYLQQNQHHHQDCGLTRYRSTPTSLFENHINGTSRTGFNEYGDFRSSSSPQMETFFMMSGNNGSSSDNVSDCHDHMQENEEKCVKQEEMISSSSSSKMMYQIQSLPLQTSFGVGSNLGLESSMQVPKIGNGNGSNLVRQSSSPAQFFSNQGLDNGFNGIRKVSTLRDCNGINSEPTSTSRLYNNHNISFSSGTSSYSKPMSQIAPIENQSVRVKGTENGSLVGNANSNGHFIPNLMTDSRHNASLSGLRRARESDGDLFSDLSRLQAQTQHLSLPKTYEEMDVVDKFWQFQGSVPCKIRAKRGFATHPRSIAERVRRTRISERMRKLQGLFPNIDKQTNTADMLDMAMDYIKDLQKQVKILKDTKAKCSC